MGLFGTLTGWDQTKAAGNAILANHLLPTLSKNVKQEIVQFIINGFNRGPNQVIQSLNYKSRVEQLNFVASACAHLGISPLLDDGIGWRYLKNPSTAGHTKPDHIDYILEDTQRRTRTKIEWPGDDERIDFSEWYKIAA